MEERVFLRELQEFVESIATACIRTTSGGVTLSSFRAPLQLSSMISPLYLLCPTVIAKKVWGRDLMLNAVFSLGNDKPELLLEVERIIWGIIFSMANGDLSPKESMMSLSNSLLWKMIEDAAESPIQRSWFEFRELRFLSIYMMTKFNFVSEIFRTVIRVSGIRFFFASCKSVQWLRDR